MNGVLVVNKPKDYTSRDIVNIISKKFNTKKVGHTGTLDPLAEGVLIVPIGKALKVAELLTSETKEYIAEVILGYETDMLDITGTEIKRNIPKVTKEDIKKTLKIYYQISSRSTNVFSSQSRREKLYEYARNNIPVTPPSKEVEIYSLDLLEDPKYLTNTIEFKIKCKVSKGTYIRSLIRDIAYDLNTYGTMKNLVRTKQGIFSLEDSYTLEDIQNDNYKLLTIREVLSNIPVTIIEKDTLKKVQNGMSLPIFLIQNYHY